jgi:hypothetical protein
MKIPSILFISAIAVSSVATLITVPFAISQPENTAAILKSQPSKVSERTQQTIAARPGQPFCDPGKVYREPVV